MPETNLQLAGTGVVRVAAVDPHQQALEAYVWQHVTWTFKITPSRGGKEGKITAEWPQHEPYTRIFNTADAKKMTMFDWIQFNQAEMIKDIMVRLEAQYGSNIPTPSETNRSTPRLSS